MATARSELPASKLSASDIVNQDTQPPGPHAVGLKVVEQYDYSRVYRPPVDELGMRNQGERARPLQTLIWYPAKKTRAKAMTVADYCGLLTTETSFGKPKPAPHLRHCDRPAAAAALWARKDAALEVGRFPVVIYAPSLSNVSFENADLCEYLASYGYVVIASPDMGVNIRLMAEDLAGNNAQSRDISFLIGYAETLPDTDMSEVAVAGYSFGGTSNVFAAARDSRVDALVDIDGSMRIWPSELKEGDVHPEQMGIPLIYFTNKSATWYKDEDPNLSPEEAAAHPLNQWTHGDLLIANMLGMAHESFGSIAGMWKRFPKDKEPDSGPEEIMAGYAWMVRYTLQFLDAYLKHDAAAMAFLKRTPEQNGVPKRVMIAGYRAAHGIPPSLNGFRAELGQKGFDHASEIYAAMHEQSADFKLDEDVFTGWAHVLIDGSHLTEAVNVIKLDEQLYPDSAEVYYLFGLAYEKSAQKQLAIDNYGKSLKLLPDFTQAQERLKTLQGATPLAK
jgi:dienelactone hydrolase